MTGNLYVIAAPSGTGKTTLVKSLVETSKNITVSISHTTRAKRPGEIDGVNYYFVSKDAFEAAIKHHDFLEYATIFDNYYGTSKRWVEETITNGTDVILEIDWQGHQQIKRLFPSSISIFILPPSLEALEERLVTRNQDNPDIIKKRLADAQETVSHVVEFDYVVVNDDFSHALSDLKTIVAAGKLLQCHQSKKWGALIADLTQKVHRA